MARGRMISTDASLDIELNNLSLEAQLLFLLTIPHLDRDGLIDAQPLRLAAQVAPLRLELRDRAAQLVNEWIEAGLAQRYAYGKGCAALFFPSFRKHQQGMEYGREPASRIPPPPGWSRSKDGMIPDDPELCFRMSEHFAATSAYRRALLAAAGADAPAPDRPPREDLANTSRTPREDIANTSRLREEKRIHDDDDLHIIHPHPPGISQGGGAGGTVGALAQLPQLDLVSACLETGSLLGLHQDWHNYALWLTGQDASTLLLLLQWIRYYHDAPNAVHDGIRNLPGVIRKHLTSGQPPALSATQQRALVAQCLALLTPAAAPPSAPAPAKSTEP